MIMIIAVRGPLQQDQEDRDAGHDEQPEHIAPGQALCLPARAIRRHGHMKGRRRFRRLQLQRADTEPAGRALALCRHEDAEQDANDQP